MEKNWKSLKGWKTEDGRQKKKFFTSDFGLRTSDFRLDLQ